MRYLLITCLLISSASFAQTKFGVFLEPSLQVSSLGYFDSQDHDSIQDIFHNDNSLNFGIAIKNNINRYNSLHFKLGFHQFGYQIIREDLQLFDEIHPAIGRINDLSQGATKMAYLHHRSQFLGFQFEYQRDITPKTKNIGVELNLGLGLGYYYLFNQDIKLVTEAFAIDNSFTHIIKEDLYFEANPHLVSASILFETVYHPKENWDLFAQINSEFPFMTLTTGQAKVYTFTPSLQVGLRTGINQ